ncbi:hypothetical protein FHT01_000496 [Sphingomonas japonica]|uniref:Uncharacterized protein n=1 Tax=Sphingomonas japonica TaxID=511662 RepID=A0ABX0U004_9SPHN|nr:hypothetical protein [Sphingomonas japonica]
MRTLLAAALCMTGALAASPAQAQFFFKSPDLRGPRATGTEPGIVGQTLPDAKPEELRAAMVWNVRAALNVAALQCGFAPTLLTLDNYNSALLDHRDELKASYDTLTGYFKRVNKTTKEAQGALDQYSTRVYQSYSAVAAQLTFCQTAASVGQQVVFAPRGTFGDVAAQRLRELRNSLVLAGEQQFPGGVYIAPKRPLPANFADPKCWKRNVWQNRRCGAFAYY